MHDSLIVEEYYNKNAENEWKRLERHPIEFEITKRIIEKFIPKNKSRIIDIGGGPGRYSFWLKQKGHDITLLDLAKSNIDYAKEVAKKSGIELDKYLVGNAMTLDKYFNDQKFDIALLMGPLYHLTSEKDRYKVIEQALSVLNEDGIVIIAFISGYAPILDVLKNYPQALNGSVDKYIEYLTNGINVVSDKNPGFTNAYFINPIDIDPFMNTFKLDKQGLYTIESILGPFENQLKLLDENTFNSCIELAMNFIEDEYCRACGEHILYVGKKKKNTGSNRTTAST